jgi:soluble cytochrome b562
MSYFLKPKSLQSDNVSEKTDEPDTRSRNLESGACYEVFRNHTTAVEVVVKEVHSKNKNKVPTPENSNINIKKLQEEMDVLKFELDKVNKALVISRKGFQIMIREMKKQLDSANNHELESQKENMVLRLENEKLKTLMECKTNVIWKYKKELFNVKKLLKFVMKTISFIPQITENIPLSDAEYDDFENDLKINTQLKHVTKVLDSTGATFDSTISKDVKDSFEIKRL